MLLINCSCLVFEFLRRLIAIAGPDPEAEEKESKDILKEEPTAGQHHQQFERSKSLYHSRVKGKKITQVNASKLAEDLENKKNI